MAILGFQVVSSLITISVLSKLTSHFSFGRYFICRKLFRFLHPSNEELKEAAGYSGPKSRSERNFRRRRQEQTGNEPETFTVPKSISYTLETVKIHPADLLPLQYYNDYQWLMDFSLCSFVVYCLNEFVYGMVYGGSCSRVNLSILWCLLTLFFAVRVLTILAKMYFKAGMEQQSESGEAMIILTSAFFFLVLSMGVLILPNSYVQIDIESAYTNFSKAAKNFLEISSQQKDISGDGPINLLSVRAVLAFLAAFLGALLTFPGFRYAKMYVDALKYASDEGQITASSLLQKGLIHLSFFSPLICLLLWLTPLTKEMKYFSKHQVATIRLYAIMLTCLLRLLLSRQHFQAYLNIAYDRAVALRKEAGRVSNLDIQKTVARIFYYLCVVALQYLAPVLILLMFSCLLKTMGDYSWDLGFFYRNFPGFLKLASPAPAQNRTADSVSEILGNFLGTKNSSWGLNEAVKEWTISLQSLKLIFTPAVYQCLLGFAVFWILLCMMITSLLGLLYHTYMT